VKAIKAGQLETLAVALAKEQKLYDKANEQLQAAVADRKKHQDAWANNKAVDPAAKAAEPQGVTDYYESLRKANELARKAATSQQTAGNTGLDSDFQKAARDASAAETAFSRVMEVINQLRTNGKITEGEFNFMNDQAGRAQDSADAGMEKTAKSTMQKAMEQIEAIKAAAAAVQKLDISVSINDQQALQDMDSMINRIQQAATAKPVKIAVELVGPDGKYRTDARSALSLADRPLSEIQSNAEGGAISGPGTGTSDSILSWLSNGEFVVKAAATSYYGPGLLHAINQMRLPRFAVGGAVGQLPAVSRAMSTVPSLQPGTGSAAMVQSGSPLNIWLPGATDPIAVQAPDTG
jgi:predicted  nucleic acid-binding Zn-ribbon protein